MQLEALRLESSWENRPFAAGALLQAMEQGKLEEAQQLLAAFPRPEWHIFANLGKAYQKSYSTLKAIEMYHLAAFVAHNTQIESRLYYQIGNSFITLEKISEARRSYEYAIQLNPDNMEAAFALQQLNAHNPNLR